MSCSRSLFGSRLWSIVAAVVLLGAACVKDPAITPSGNGGRSGRPGGGGGTNGGQPDPNFTFGVADAGSLAPDRPPGYRCDNLCLKQMKCANGKDTTISGVVHAPTPPTFG